MSHMSPISEASVIVRSRSDIAVDPECAVAAAQRSRRTSSWAAIASRGAPTASTEAWRARTAGLLRSRCLTFENASLIGLRSGEE